MKRIFDIAAEVGEQVARFTERTGVDPETCCVSREIYRLLIEENAMRHTIGNLIIGTNPVAGIITDTAYMRVVVDETLGDCEIEVE